MRISGLALRVSVNEEKRGIDESEIGYFAYDFALPDEGHTLSDDEDSDSDADSDADHDDDNDSSPQSSCSIVA